VSKPDLHSVDWSAIPHPSDDGAAAHLIGMQLPDIELEATSGETVALARLAGLTVVYIYPMTSRPDRLPVEGWDMIPGARGCTPQSCSFRDHFGELKALGAGYLFGLSVQSTQYQREAVERLHLPFDLLSDANFTLQAALRLPTFEVGDMRLLKRLTLIIRDGFIEHIFYPVFPPDRNADDVITWLKAQTNIDN
jgi:peroxiredoxin